MKYRIIASLLLIVVSLLMYVGTQTTTEGNTQPTPVPQSTDNAGFSSIK